MDGFKWLTETVWIAIKGLASYASVLGILFSTLSHHHPTALQEHLQKHSRAKQSGFHMRFESCDLSCENFIKLGCYLNQNSTPSSKSFCVRPLAGTSILRPLSSRTPIQASLAAANATLFFLALPSTSYSSACRWNILARWACALTLSWVSNQFIAVWRISLVK
jgi:hypothetical protein